MANGRDYTGRDGGTSPVTAQPGQLTPGAAAGYSTAYGGIPSVPDPTTTAGQAITGNIGNLGSLYSLAAPTNLFNQQQAALGLQTNLPGYTGMLGQATANTGANLQGQIPQDVTNLIAQQAAERGVATGSPGGPNANAAYLRALGLTSTGLQAQGQQQLGQLIGMTPQATPFNPASFFVTPQQQQQAQAAANLYGSAPVPSAAAGAAMGAARAGMGAAGGSPTISAPHPTPTTTPFASSWGGPGAPTVGLSSATTMNYPGASPQMYSDWASWAAGIGQGPATAGTGTTYMGENPNAPGQGVPYTDPATGQTYPDMYSVPASAPASDFWSNLTPSDFSAYE